jgi:hypothetical protein
LSVLWISFVPVVSSSSRNPYHLAPATISAIRAVTLISTFCPVTPAVTAAVALGVVRTAGAFDQRTRSSSHLASMLRTVIVCGPPLHAPRR